MGQMQNKNEGSEPMEGKHHIHEPLKDRRGASFEARTKNVVSPNATGEGRGKGNPGKPT